MELTDFDEWDQIGGMNGPAVIEIIETLGGRQLRQRGSHVRMVCACGVHFTVVALHGSQGVPTGTLRAIERDLEPCFGKGWLRK